MHLQGPLSVHWLTVPLKSQASLWVSVGWDLIVWQILGSWGFKLFVPGGSHRPHPSVNGYSQSWECLKNPPFFRNTGSPCCFIKANTERFVWMGSIWSLRVLLHAPCDREGPVARWPHKPDIQGWPFRHMELKHLLYMSQQIFCHFPLSVMTGMNVLWDAVETDSCHVLFLATIQHYEMGKVTRNQHNRAFVSHCAYYKNVTINLGTFLIHMFRVHNKVSKAKYSPQYKYINML